MATLNGAEFKIIEAEWSTYQNNVIQEILGSDAVEVQNQGHGSEPIRIQGMVNNEKEMDDFQEQFYSNGVLTFIKDPGSDRQYQVYALGNVRRENITNSLLDQGIIFTCMMQLRYPYSESVDTITRSKSITTQNQEWNTDDDGQDIKTSGNVDAVPDIKITGGLKNGVDISQTTSNWSLPFSVAIGQTFIPTGTKITRIDVKTRSEAWGGPVDITLNIYNSLSKTTLLGSEVVEMSAPNTVYTYNFDPEVEIVSGTMFMQFSTSGTSGRLGASSTNTYADGQVYNGATPDPNRDIYMVVYTDSVPAKDIVIYNIADSTTKLNLTNEVLSDAIHRINVDGTGTVDYDDDFSTGKYDIDSTNLNCTHDYINDELDIADDGYIYWKIDSKLPINGIPTLSSRTNITSGIPTIQISTDGSSWYDIDTAIVDDVETEYPLDSDGNLSLGGKTLFYFRYDCVKAAAATCSIKSFELNVTMHTIYAKNPKITKGSSPSTFRIDQDAASGMACTIDLIFKNWWWV